MLTAVVAYAWTKLKRVITKIYGSDVSLWFSLITLTQFHFMFYMSRPLPNIMALPVGKFASIYDEMVLEKFPGEKQKWC